MSQLLPLHGRDIPRPHLEMAAASHGGPVPNCFAIERPLRRFRNPLVDVVPMRRPRGTQRMNTLVAHRGNKEESGTIAIFLVDGSTYNEGYPLGVRRQAHTLLLA